MQKQYLKKIKIKIKKGKHGRATGTQWGQWTHRFTLCLCDVFELGPCQRRTLRAARNLAEGETHLGVVGERIQRLGDVPLLLRTLYSRQGKLIAAAAPAVHSCLLPKGFNVETHILSYISVIMKHTACSQYWETTCSPLSFTPRYSRLLSPTRPW